MPGTRDILHIAVIFEHCHHVLGIGLPICRQVESSLRGYACQQQIYKVRLNKTALMMTLFVPGIGEENLNKINCLGWNLYFENAHRILGKDFNIFNAALFHLGK